MTFLTDIQIVEGIIGSLSWGIFWIYLRNYMKLNSYLEGAVAWILVWICRKIGVSIYLKFKSDK